MTNPPDEKSQWICGRNPVLEALHSGISIEKIYMLYHARGPKLAAIHRLARQQHIPVVQADRHKLDQLAGGIPHQGVVALTSPIPLLSLDTFLERIEQAPEQPKVLLLDRIQDPHNMGAIIRSAAFFGAHGVVFSPRDSTPITPIVVKASSGGVYRLPICRVSKLSQAIAALKEMDFWVFGTVPRAERSIWEADFQRRCAILIGNEARGIRPSLLKQCDELLCIPGSGQLDSLNASVAAAIILGEIFRQQRT